MRERKKIRMIRGYFEKIELLGHGVSKPEGEAGFEGEISSLLGK